MTYKSKYISERFRAPDGWTPEEFWWAVEKLETYGTEDNLLELANKLGIRYCEGYKGKVPVDQLVLVITTEGGVKEEIIAAIEQFCKANA